MNLGAVPPAGWERASQAGQLTAGEQGVDRVFDAGRLRQASGQWQPAGRHSISADGCDVVTACLAIVAAVDLTAQRIGHERAVDDQLLGFRRGELAAGRERYAGCSIRCKLAEATGTSAPSLVVAGFLFLPLPEALTLMTGAS